MNSLPFGQLKSFLKILIGVQYERLKKCLTTSGKITHFGDFPEVFLVGTEKIKK